MWWRGGGYLPFSGIRFWAGRGLSSGLGVMLRGVATGTEMAAGMLRGGGAGAFFLALGKIM